ncbi:Succinate--CoA ligase [GDP-forming] subunit beta, mitochondrial, partial [Podila epigama]
MKSHFRRVPHQARGRVISGSIPTALDTIPSPQPVPPPPSSLSSLVAHGTTPPLKYAYPSATRQIVNNIAETLLKNPQFYTNVLHLMNKMNLAPPFTVKSLAAAPKMAHPVASVVMKSINLPISKQAMVTSVVEPTVMTSVDSGTHGSHVANGTGLKRKHKDDLLSSDESEVDSEPDEDKARKSLVEKLTKTAGPLPASSPKAVDSQNMDLSTTLLPASTPTSLESQPNDVSQPQNVESTSSSGEMSESVHVPNHAVDAEGDHNMDQDTNSLPVAPKPDTQATTLPGEGQGPAKSLSKRQKQKLRKRQKMLDATECIERTERAEPTERTESTDPTERTEPTDPTERTEPTESIKLTQPSQPTEPTQLTETESSPPILPSKESILPLPSEKGEVLHMESNPTPAVSTPSTLTPMSTTPVTGAVKSASQPSAETRLHSQTTPTVPSDNMTSTVPDPIVLVDLDALMATKSASEGAVKAGTIPKEPNENIHILSLSPAKSTRNDLINIFARYFEPMEGIHEPNVFKYFAKGRLRNQAFIQMPSIEKAVLAIEQINGCVLNGRPMVVPSFHPLKAIVLSQVRHLNLHEYQAKQLMAKHNINVQRFAIAETVEQAENAAKGLKAEEIVIKAQIHTGGRGKGEFSSGLKSG